MCIRRQFCLVICLSARQAVQNEQTDTQSIKNGAFRFSSLRQSANAGHIGDFFTHIHDRLTYLRASLNLHMLECRGTAGFFEN